MNQKQGNDFFRLMARYSPVIMLMPASALAGYLIGYGLDYLFSTTFLRFVFLILGVVSGIVQLIRILGRERMNADFLRSRSDAHQVPHAAGRLGGDGSDVLCARPGSRRGIPGRSRHLLRQFRTAPRPARM